MTLEILLEYGAYGPRSKAVPGEEWRASYYDRAADKRPAGSGPTPWEAIAWMLVDAEATRRGLVVIALDGRDTPATFLSRITEAA